MKKYEITISNYQEVVVCIEIDEKKESIEQVIESAHTKGLNWIQFEKYSEPYLEIEVTAELPTEGKVNKSDLNNYFLD